MSDAVEYTDEELLDHLRELADDDDGPSASGVASSEGPALRTYQYRFGSYNEAVERAGLEPAPAGGGREYSDEELLDHLRELADGDDGPTVSEVNSAEGPSDSLYHHRFRSYNEAVERAGLEPNSVGEPAQYTEEELLDHLRELADGDDAPSISEVNSAGGPAGSLYHHRFGSYNEAVTQAGLEPSPVGGQREYSDEELLSWIRAFVLEFGVVPRPPDAESWPGPGVCAYRYRFGGWKAAVREAGFEPAGGGSE